MQIFPQHYPRCGNFEFAVVVKANLLHTYRNSYVMSRALNCGSVYFAS